MIKLLIVDNGAIPQTSYHEEFSKAGYEVMLAANVGEAMQKMPDYNPDMFILDMSLPDMDGVAVINSIIQTNKSQPVIINSAHFRYKGNFSWSGSKTHLIKSSDSDDLKCKMAAYLSSEPGFTVLLPSNSNGTQQLVFFSE